jgi:hypothetical protein
MQSYVVVWSGELEKRPHDQQVRPAPPVEHVKAPPPRSYLRDAAGLRVFFKLCRTRARQKVH